MTRRRQISPITVHNPKPKDSSGESEYGNCHCCGEEANTYGMCLSCVNAGCKADFDVACWRNGETDPLNKTVTMFGVE